MNNMEYGGPTPPAESNGCMKGCFIGCSVLAFIVFVLLFIGYSTVMHSAVPLQLLAKLLSHDPNIEITGVDGSISSGASAEKIRIKDDSGKMNEIDNVGFKYAYGDDYVELKELFLERAHLYYDDNEEPQCESSTTTNTEVKQSDSYDEIKRLLITKVNITDMIFENIETGDQTKIDKIFMDSIVLEDDNSSLKEITVASTFCNISVLPFAPSVEDSDKYTFSASIQKAIHPRILKDINAKGTFLMNRGGYEEGKLSAFDGAVVCSWIDGKARLKVNNFSPTDYYSHMLYIRDINLDLVENHNGKNTAKTANFKIGRRVFEIDKAVFDEDEVPDILEAVSEGKEIVYYCSLRDNEDDFPLAELSSKPAMSLKDILAMLLFEKKFDALSPADKKGVERQLQFCTLGS